MVRRTSTFVAFVAALCATSAVQAGSIDLCGGAAGWRATWDNSLDGLVQIIAADCSQLANGRVFIEKSAEFTQGPSPSGVFPTIAITFQQTGPTNVNRIIIEDEIITNSTGSPWTDFHMDLIDSGDAWFDVAATAGSGGPPPIGFSIAPFTQASFTNFIGPGPTRLDILGGVVPHGTIWFPGSGALDGELHIAVNPHASAPFTTFSLKETPTPEPASLSLLAIGAAVALRRRR